MTDAERKFLDHLLRYADLCVDGARHAAKRYARCDPYQLAKLPDLLEDALKEAEHARA